MSAALAALLLAVPVAGTAGAAEGPGVQPAPPGSGEFLESWALAPTGTDPSQPSSRAFLAYDLAPGASQTDSVTLWNFSDVPLTFNVYATDAFNNKTGDFALLPTGATPTDAGSWIKLQTDNVTVEPKTKVDIPITITVPDKASPGDHTAGIVAAVPTPTVDASGKRITVVRRTGSRAYVRVQGQVNQSLVVKNLSSDYSGSANPLDGTFNVSYTLSNTGNVRLGAHQVIEVKDLIGRTVATRKLRDVDQLLPGNQVKFTEQFTGVPATFRVSADVTVTPFSPTAGSNEKLPSSTTSSTSSWAVPWTLLLVIALLVLVWRLYRRWSNARSPRTTAAQAA